MIRNGFDNQAKIAQTILETIRDPHSETFCITCGSQETEPHHMDEIGSGGNRKDLWNPKHLTAGAPLCRACHTEYHADPGKFEQKYGVNMWAESLRWLVYFISGKFLGYKGR